MTPIAAKWLAQAEHYDRQIDEALAKRERCDGKTGMVTTLRSCAKEMARVEGQRDAWIECAEGLAARVQGVNDGDFRALGVFEELKGRA
jgi:hypothetical protein